MNYIILTGRVLFALLFINSGLFHFSSAALGYAQSMNVPAASFLVPFSGAMAIAGAFSILLGFKARWGAWLLVAFLLPVTFMMHAFWKVSDPMMNQMQMTMFMKNLSLLGAALLIAHFGSGPLSLDARIATKQA